MTVYYYTFRTMTEALMAAKKLKAGGFAVTPVRTPERLRKRGCGYCIPVPEDRFFRLSHILQQGDYEKLYQYTRGEWREMSR
ncbi:MAG: DUF3343 domain-containing protein [Oscillospiraceae bacterium]|nr:DUF3343 domain-containing protein [Oscillospiraceae bacterium]